MRDFRWGLMLVAACGDGAAPAPLLAPPPSATASASAAAALPPVAPAEAPCGLEARAVCLDAATRLSCDAGTATVERCAADTGCLGGSCRALELPVARVRVPSAESFWNAWSGFVGIGPKAKDALLAGGDLADVGSEASARAVCGADGWVSPRRKSEDGDPRASAILVATLISDRPQKLELRAGVVGRLELRVGGASATFEELPGREGRALPDERFVTIEVPAGATPVTAALTPDTGGFWLRARDAESGGLPTGVALAERFAKASCSEGALLDTGARLELAADGLHLRGSARFHGLVPAPGADPLAMSVALVTGPGADGTRVDPIAIDRVAATRGPGARIDRLLALPEKGALRVKATVVGVGPRDAGQGLRKPPGEIGEEVALERALPDLAKLAPRAQKLLAAEPAIAADAALPEGSRASFSAHVAQIADALARGETDRSFVEKLLSEAEPLAEKLARHEDAYKELRGIVRRAYRSPLDGRLAPYITFVPRSLDRLAAKGKEAPLVLISHGRDRLPEHALRTLIGEAPDEHMTLAFAAHHLPGFPDQGAILAAPYQYGNGGTQAPGEQDLLRVIDELAAAYPVDKQRVGLTGYSLGGTVSFSVPLHFPDRFAAAAPLCGYPNLLDYQSVARVPHLSFGDALLEKEYLVRYAENGLHVPLRIVHGGQDVPGRSKVVADRYKALGYSHTFDIQEDLDHNVWDYAYEDAQMVPWLTAKSAPRAPSRVRFSTGKYRYDRAYWLRVVKLEDAGSKERALIDARWDEKTRRFTIEASGVRALELDLARLGASTGSDIQIEVGGDALRAAPSDRLLLARGADGHFAVAGDAAAVATGKQHGSSGPLDDVLHGPLTIVVGTRGAADREANLLLADQLARLGGSADIRYPVLFDVDATDAALAGRSIVLVGGPRSNALTERLAPALPVSFSERALTLRGERFEGDDLGVALIFPGPESIEGPGLAKRSTARYVVLYAGLTPRATLAARMLPRYLPDYVVFGADLAVQRGGLLFDQRKVRSAGFFSEAWE